ncbi:TPA: hypothetical protein ACSPZZ_001286 [Aeromonas hydrophila]
MYFDVTIITTYRVGTDSLCKYISKHHDIYCPGFYGMGFRANIYSKKTFAEIIACKRKVFMWHDGYTDILYNGKIPILPKYLIHPIRHPYEQAIACYNASLQHAILNNIENNILNVEDYLVQHGKYIFGNSLHHVNHHSNFDSVKIIDFSGLSSGNINRTMNDIYRWLGVDTCANFENDSAFHKSEVDFYLEKIPLRVEAINLSWNFYFIRENVETPNNLYPIGIIECSDFGTLKVCLMKDELHTNRFGYSNIMADDVAQIIRDHFANWLQLLQEKIMAFSQYKISSLPTSVINLINKESFFDYQKILKINPEIEQLWRDKWM